MSVLSRVRTPSKKTVDPLSQNSWRSKFFLHRVDPVEQESKSITKMVELPHCKKIRRFYGKLPGNQLPVHIPLFLRASVCRTFLEIQKWVMLTDNTQKYLLGFKGYMTKSNTCLFATVLCLIPENVYGLP